MESQEVIKRDNISSMKIFVDEIEYKNVVSCNKETKTVKYIHSDAHFPYWPTVVVGDIRIERVNNV